MTQLTAFNITFDTGDFASIYRFVRAYNISAYDAAYLELAKRKNYALATNDKKLKKASVKEKVEIF